MNTRAIFVACLAFAAVLAGAQASTFEAVPLQHPTDAYEPAIDNATMYFHSMFHYATFLTNLNNLTAAERAYANRSLTDLVKSVDPAAGWNASDPNQRTVRNSGGGAWNHALFWKILTPVNSTEANTSSISSTLNTRIRQAFGTVQNMTALVSAAANTQFGSGWAWVCVNRNGTLSVLSTPNQDNPLMPIVIKPACTPILGIDVWEHAYYLRYQYRRRDYVSAFWSVVNWKKVSQNYVDALAGNYERIAQ